MKRGRELAAGAVLAALPIVTCLALGEPPPTDVSDFAKLVGTYRGKAFCPPPAFAVKDAAGVVVAYVRSHPELQGRYSDQQALEALVAAYPCRLDPNMQLSDAVGRRVTVQPTGVYADIDTKPDIATIHSTRFGSSTEAAESADRVAQNSGNFSPAVLFALSEWYYRRENIEKAIFWLNAAGLRGRFDAEICTDPSAKSAVAELSEKVSLDVYRQQFQDLGRIRRIVDNVIAWDAQTPSSYDHRWISLHGLKSMNSALGVGASEGPLTVPSSQWARIAADNRIQYRSQMLQHIQSLEK